MQTAFGEGGATLYDRTKEMLELFGEDADISVVGSAFKKLRFEFR